MNDIPIVPETLTATIDLATSLLQIFTYDQGGEAIEETSADVFRHRSATMLDGRSRTAG